MTFSRTVRMLAALSLLGCLSGCGIPDLVAHGVKEIEKSNRSGGSSSASSQPAQAQPQYQSRTEEEPPPPSAPAAARRSSVTVEELKP